MRSPNGERQTSFANRISADDTRCSLSHLRRPRRGTLLSCATSVCASATNQCSTTCQTKARNCIPSTLSLLVIATAFDKSRLRMVVSITLQCFTAVVKMFFSAAGFFTPLDLDPHSATTKLVFVFAPIFLLGPAIVACCVAWLVARAK